MLTFVDNVVVGAGPVGLLMATFLGAAGQRVLVVEKLQSPANWSRAIGVSPPSLEILADLALDQDLISRGHPIQHVGVHGRKGAQNFLGRVSFAGIPCEYPYMLTIPQEDTEDVLRKGLSRYPNIELRFGQELTGIATRRHLSVFSSAASVNERPESYKSESGDGFADGAVLTLRDASSGKNYQVEAGRVFGCDGAKSTLRELLGIAWTGHRYPYSFVMGDFHDTSEFGAEARLFFTPSGAVESFPLPKKMRRWIVQTKDYESDADAEFIASTVKKRTGLEVDASQVTWLSPFGVQRASASRYRVGNCFLVGDSAHIMSPIGSQGMNTGFAAAEALAKIIREEIAHEAKGTAPDTKQAWRETALADWERQRKKAFRVAANRAWRSMTLGTVRGWLAGALRNLVLWVMLNGPFKSRVPLDYAMLTIPYRNLRAEYEASMLNKRKKLA